jgi:hypothetical protein
MTQGVGVDLHEVKGAGQPVNGSPGAVVGGRPDHPLRVIVREGDAPPLGRQVLVAGQPVGVPLGDSDRRAGPEVLSGPDGPAVRTGEQPQLPVAGLAPQEPQHRPGVGAG